MDYRRPRIIGALGLLLVAGVLMLIDSFSETYAVDNITLGLVLGTASVLLGVEAIMKRLG